MGSLTDSASPMLVRYLLNHLLINAMNFIASNRELSVWTSNMRRAKDTAREVKSANHIEWRSLREIEVT